MSPVPWSSLASWASYAYKAYELFQKKPDRTLSDEQMLALFRDVHRHLDEIQVQLGRIEEGIDAILVLLEEIPDRVLWKDIESRLRAQLTTLGHIIAALGDSAYQSGPARQNYLTSKRAQLEASRTAIADLVIQLIGNPNFGLFPVMGHGVYCDVLCTELLGDDNDPQHRARYKGYVEFFKSSTQGQTGLVALIQAKREHKEQLVGRLTAPKLLQASASPSRSANSARAVFGAYASQLLTDPTCQNDAVVVSLSGLHLVHGSDLPVSLSLLCEAVVTDNQVHRTHQGINRATNEPMAKEEWVKDRPLYSEELTRIEAEQAKLELEHNTLANTIVTCVAAKLACDAALELLSGRN